MTELALGCNRLALPNLDLGSRGSDRGKLLLGKTCEDWHSGEP